MKLENVDLSFNDYVFIEDQEAGYLVYNKKTKEESIIPKPKFAHGQFVKTSGKHYSKKDFTRVISPSYTDNRGWVYGESYCDIYGNPGGAGYWIEEANFEPLNDPLLLLYAERLKHIETIKNHQNIVRQREEFLNKIQFSLDIIVPKWREQFKI